MQSETRRCHLQLMDGAIRLGARTYCRGRIRTACHELRRFTLPRMSRGRLEAFSDGVLAIVITIMVLELVPPHEATIEALLALWPKFLAYVMSFAYIGIYWVNHHH